MDNRERFWDKFTARARKVLELAQEEARYFRHNAIGSEHLLLGLIREGESAAARVLASLDVTLEKVRQAVEEAKGRGNDIVQGEMGLTAHADMVIEMAVKVADSRHPRTEYPLLGTQYMQESEALKILQSTELSERLKSLGVTLEKVREAVEEAKGRGDNIVHIQIETGMAPFANRKENDTNWHHPLFSIGTEDLLLGLINVPEGSAVKILQDLGVPPFLYFWTLLHLERVTTLQTTNQGYIQRFTRQARKAWSLAHEEVRHRQDGYIGGSHLLMGLVGEGGGVAAKVLGEMGVRLAEMRDVFERSSGRGNRVATGDITLQPLLQNIIELASNEARRLYHPFIGTGHLLLMLVHEDEGIEAGLLKGLGVDLDELRAATRRALAEKTGESEQEAEAVIDEISEEGLYVSIASIERDLQSRELDKTLLAVYPFTPEARKALEIARDEARFLAQRVGPEHMLLGLASLTSRDGLVSKVLKGVGIDSDSMQVAIESRQGRETQAAPV
ncbi:MAG: hypothetical protein J2P37_33770, partial [Ktedonobacteraceae bacterium]|nr:hypothetical protein [Ktedonobacteraceae bacterium]